MAGDRGRGRSRRSANRSSRATTIITNIWDTASKYQQQYVNKQLLMNFVFNPTYTWLIAIILLLGDVIGNIIIIEKVKCEYVLVFFQ